jgi:hypothetical protein
MSVRSGTHWLAAQLPPFMIPKAPFLVSLQQHADVLRLYLAAEGAFAVLRWWRRA